MGGSREKDLVARGYDRVSYAYRPDDPVAEAQYTAWLAPLLEELEPGSRVLDLGCGCGVPVCKLLSRRFCVTGVDISRVQVERARSLVPEATFIQADMTQLSFPPEAFHAVVCLYAIIHVPIAAQPGLIASVFQWTRQSGLVLMTVGSDAWTGTENDWLGVPGGTMYWSHADAGTYRQWFREAGFIVVDEDFVTEGEGGHQKFLLRRPELDGAE